jgi:CheY-like chemotaxis protein
VVVVDDNVDVARAVSAAVQVTGHQVHVVHDAPAALAAIASVGADVAVVDIGLPGMDGYELARRVRASSGARIFLIALTGYSEPSYRERSRDAGFDAHIVKPIDLPSLRALLDGAQAARRKPPPG